MPGLLLTMSAAMLCAHAGKANFTAPNPRVKIMGVPIPMSAPPVAIAGCTFVPPPPGKVPDVIANWIPPTHTLRVKSMGMPLVCETSKAIAVPTGTPISIAFAGQVRVKGM